MIILILGAEIIIVHHRNQMSQSSDNVLAELKAARRNPVEALKYE